MAITKQTPNTVDLTPALGVLVNDLVAIETITPGMVLEYHSDSGTLKFGVHDTADDPVEAIVAIEQDELNDGVSDTYAAGDLVKAKHYQPGAMFWAIIPSGQNISVGARLQSNGDGKLKALATGTGKFIALEAKNATADTRIRVTVG